MKYWVFQNNQVAGPFDKEEVAQVKGFGAESLVCPEGRKGTEMGDWQRAGVVADLSDALLKTGRVATATRAVGGNLLPPEPTLRDLAVLGTLQEKTTLLENTFNTLQEDFRARDTEIARLKTDLAAKDRELADFQAKLSEMEIRLGDVAGLKEELGNDEKRLQELQSELSTAKDELRRDISKTSEEEHAAESKLAEAEAKLSATEAKLAEQGQSIQDLKIRVERGAPLGGSPSPLPRLPGGMNLQPLSAELSTPPSTAAPKALEPKPLERMEPLTAPPISKAAGLPAFGGAQAAAPPISGGAALPPLPGSSSLPPLVPSPSLEAPKPEAAGAGLRPLEFTSALDAADMRSGGPRGMTDLSTDPSANKTGAGMAMPPLQPLQPPVAAAPAKKGFSKAWIAAGVVALLAVGGLVVLGPSLLKPKPRKLAVPKPEAPPAETAAPAAPAMPGAPAMPQAAPGTGSPAGSPMTAPSAEPPVDPSQAATDLVKSYAIPGINMTVAQRLEAAFPPDPSKNLAPWMVERLGDGQYQVVFYTNKNSLTYQFKAVLKSKSVEGINAPAQAVLNGEDPTPPAPPKPAKAKRRRPAPKARSAKRRSAGRAPSESLAPKLGDTLIESTAKPEAPAEPSDQKPAAAPAGEEPPAAAPSDEDNKTLDELLLPGAPKGGGKKGGAAPEAPPEDPPPPDAGGGTPAP